MITEWQDKLTRVCTEIERRIVGQSRVIRHLVAACVAGGHVLLEDIPGTGKTTLANALAEVLGLTFSRVQGTPDLLPSDVVGTMVFHPAEAAFQFRPGPVFTQILLVDEINRTTPRTQSALLEAMAEGHVTVDGETRVLDRPFIVIATANPIESQGIFPLPEAQLDRFLVQLRLGYTNEEEEFAMVQRIRLGEQVELRPQLTAAELLAARKAAAAVHIADDVLRYIIALCRASRTHESVVLGASPRATLQLTAYSQALALLAGRTFIIPDDVQEAFMPVMEHRIQTRVNWSSVGRSEETAQVLEQVLASVTVPTEFVTEA